MRHSYRMKGDTIDKITNITLPLFLVGPSLLRITGTSLRFDLPPK